MRCRTPSDRFAVPFLIVLLLSLAPALAAAQSAPPKILLVVAHPDDELVVAASAYRLAQERGALIDQVIITNGEGGYRYSTLAEKVYGVELTKEEVGRRELPDIRKREALAAGRLLGLRAHFFLDEPDLNNSANPDDVLTTGVWHTDAILTRLGALLARGQYDYVLTALPRADLGGHHLAAVLLTLRAVARMPGDARPATIAAYFTPDPFSAPAGSEFGGFTGAADYDFDRTRKFGFNNGLSYQIVVNWMIAEHKSQGLYQNNMGAIAHEYFWVLDRSVGNNLQRARALFALLEP